MTVPGVPPRMVGPVEATSRAIRGTFRWNGRATRAEYWWWSLAVTIISIIITVIRSLLTADDSALTLVVSLIVLVVTIWLSLISLAVSVRRLHDIGRGAWWVIVGLVLAIISIPLLFAGIFAGAAIANAGDSNTGGLIFLAGIAVPFLTGAWGIVLFVFALLPSTAKSTKWDDGFRID